LAIVLSLVPLFVSAVLLLLLALLRAVQISSANMRPGTVKSSWRMHDLFGWGN
jgi:hypothetical protein